MLLWVWLESCAGKELSSSKKVNIKGHGEKNCVFLSFEMLRHIIKLLSLLFKISSGLSLPLLNTSWNFINVIFSYYCPYRTVVCFWYEMHGTKNIYSQSCSETLLLLKKLNASCAEPQLVPKPFSHKQKNALRNLHSQANFSLKQFGKSAEGRRVTPPTNCAAVWWINLAKKYYKEWHGSLFT